MDDKQIVDLYWARSETAIVETEKKYGRYCYYIANQILSSDEDAKEVVNDTYLKTWNTIPPQRPTKLKPYVGMISRQLALDTYEAQHTQKRGGQLSLVLDELSELVFDSNNVEQELNTKELANAIDKFLDTLSPKKRSIFVCRYWYTDSVSEIAARYGMKEGAVSMTLNRLRKKLHNYLLERGIEI